jgi:acetoin utilization deacetylase AcuC-like enzyme
MKTFYQKGMSAESGSFSPSAAKPQKFIEYLKVRNVPLELVEDFKPADRHLLSLAHDPLMVEGILDMRIANGFGNKSADVARSLPYTTGSFLAASDYAVKHQTNTFSPTSGFHHAGYAYNGGFCSLNGLMVSAQYLKKEKLAQKVGILDIDNHFGDGTEDIIKRLKLHWVHHYTFGAHGIEPRNANVWLAHLPKELEKFKDCDVIFYQAGGDVHINDPLGGALTTEQMRQRDLIVFSTFSRMGIPVVFNLAGGYQNPLEKVLALHLTTYEIALTFSKEK